MERERYVEEADGSSELTVILDPERPGRPELAAAYLGWIRIGTITDFLMGRSVCLPRRHLPAFVDALSDNLDKILKRESFQSNIIARPCDRVEVEGFTDAYGRYVADFFEERTEYYALTITCSVRLVRSQLLTLIDNLDRLYLAALDPEDAEQLENCAASVFQHALELKDGLSRVDLEHAAFDLRDRRGLYDVGVSHVEDLALVKAVAHRARETPAGKEE